MNHSHRQLFGGSAKVFLSEALLLPTGLITAAYLTRKLGPRDYGLFTLASVLVAWIQWSITSIFARATFKFVAEAEDWRSIGSTVLRMHLLVSLIAAALLCLFASTAAHVLNEPDLVLYLIIFAIDIPVFSLAHAHRNVLIGKGEFQQRAWTSAGRWIARLIFIILLVELGLSVTGAILGSIVASLVELLIGRWFVRLPFFYPLRFPFRKLWDYALPLFLFAMSMRIYEKLDLISLKVLGGTASDAGIYGAAQNLSLVVSIFSLSFAPLLLSTLSNLIRKEEESEAKELSVNSMRVILWLLPFAAMTVGAAHEIVPAIFGEKFQDGAPVLSYLIFGGLALAMISVTTSILTAIGRPGLTFGLAGPLVPLSLAGYWILVPRFGSLGAAQVQTGIAVFGALCTVFALKFIWGILPPFSTVVRSLLVCFVAYFASSEWSTPGFWVAGKIGVIILLIAICFTILGEWNIRKLLLNGTLFQTRGE